MRPFQVYFLESSVDVVNDIVLVWQKVSIIRESEERMYIYSE